MSNENINLTEKIENYFLLDEFPDDILQIKFNQKKVLSKKIYSLYYENILNN